MLNNMWMLSLFLISSTGLAGLAFGPEVRIDTFPGGTTGGVDVVMLSNGRFLVLWEGERTQPQYFRAWCSYSDDFGASWSENIPISDNEAVTTQFPRLVCDSMDNVYAVWEDWRGPESNTSYFSRSSDGGETWLWPNVKISDDGQVGFGPDIATNADGSRLVAVFVRLNEKRVYSSYSTDGGDSWSDDVPVGDYTTAGQYYPVVACTGEQSFAVLWKDERDTVSYVYCSVSEDGGATWLTPNIPVPCGGHSPLSASVDLYWDGTVLHAFWIEVYTTMDAYVCEAYYSRSTDLGYTWLDASVLIFSGGSNTQMQRGGLWSRDPENIYAVWCSMKNQSYPIYAVCSISSDSGKTWSDTLRANPVSGEAGRCDIFGDVSTGEVLLAWSNLTNQHIMCSRGYDTSGITPHLETAEIQVSRNPFSGTVDFSVIGQVVPEELSVFDSAGRLVVSLNCSVNGVFTWTPSKNNPPGIYFVRGSAESCSITARIVRL